MYCIWTRIAVRKKQQFPNLIKTMLTCTYTLTFYPWFGAQVLHVCINDTHSFMSFEGEELLGCVAVAGSVLIFSSVQAVPMARTTRPDSPSRSKHCRYPTAAFPPISSTFRPIFLCNSPTSETQMHLVKHHMSQENIDRSVSDCTCIRLQRHRKQSSSKSSFSRWSYPKQLKAHLVRVDQ